MQEQPGALHSLHHRKHGGPIDSGADHLDREQVEDGVRRRAHRSDREQDRARADPALAPQAPGRHDADQRRGVAGGREQLRDDRCAHAAGVLADQLQDPSGIGDADARHQQPRQPEERRGNHQRRSRQAYAQR